MDEKHTTLATIDEQSKAKADLEFTDETGVTHLPLDCKSDEETLRSLLPILQTENYILPTVTTDTKPLSITEIIAEKTAFQSRAIRRTSR